MARPSEGKRTNQALIHLGNPRPLPKVPLRTPLEGTLCHTAIMTNKDDDISLSKFLGFH